MYDPEKWQMSRNLLQSSLLIPIQSSAIWSIPEAPRGPTRNDGNSNEHRVWACAFDIPTWLCDAAWAIQTEKIKPTQSYPEHRTIEPLNLWNIGALNQANLRAAANIFSVSSCNEIDSLHYNDLSTRLFTVFLFFSSIVQQQQQLLRDFS